MKSINSFNDSCHVTLLCPNLMKWPIWKHVNHPHLGCGNWPACDLFCVSFGIPLNPRLGCLSERDSRASGTTSNGSALRVRLIYNIQLFYISIVSSSYRAYHLKVFCFRNLSLRIHTLGLQEQWRDPTSVMFVKIRRMTFSYTER